MSLLFYKFRSLTPPAMRIFWPIITCVLVCFLIWYFAFRKPQPDPYLLKLQQKNRVLEQERDSLRSKILEESARFDMLLEEARKKDSVILMQKQNFRVRRSKISFASAGNRELDSLIWVLGYDTARVAQ